MQIWQAASQDQSSGAPDFLAVLGLRKVLRCAQDFGSFDSGIQQVSVSFPQVAVPVELDAYPVRQSVSRSE